MKRVPLRSQEGQRHVNRGPASREHPDYYSSPEPEEIPWHTEQDVELAVKRMRALLERDAGAFTGYERRCRDLFAYIDYPGGDLLLENLARVALGMRVMPR